MTFLANIEKFVPDLKDRAILDLGCGRGDDLLELAHNGCDVVGIDINQEYLDIVEAKAKAINLVVKLVKGEAEGLPFQDKSFDFITCSEVTEHVENPEKILKECYRVLKPGGKVYISFHNRFGPYDHHYHAWFINWMPRRLADIVIRFLGKDKGEGREAGRQKLSQMHYFTYGAAEKLMRKCNFAYLDMREAQVRNPKLTSRRVLKVAAKLGMSAPLAFAIKKFVGTFHFILEKR